MTDQPLTPIDYQKFRKILTIHGDNDDKVNERLSQGWTLLSIYTSLHIHGETSANFILGWAHQDEPPKTKSELAFTRRYSGTVEEL